MAADLGISQHSRNIVRRVQPFQQPMPSSPPPNLSTTRIIRYIHILHCISIPFGNSPRLKVEASGLSSLRSPQWINCHAYVRQHGKRPCTQCAVSNGKDRQRSSSTHTVQTSADTIECLPVETRTPSPTSLCPPPVALASPPSIPLSPALDAAKQCGF